MDILKGKRVIEGGNNYLNSAIGYYFNRYQSKYNEI